MKRAPFLATALLIVATTSTSHASEFRNLLGQVVRSAIASQVAPQVHVTPRHLGPARAPVVYQSPMHTTHHFGNWPWPGMGWPGNPCWPGNPGGGNWDRPPVPIQPLARYIVYYLEHSRWRRYAEYTSQWAANVAQDNLRAQGYRTYVRRHTLRPLALSHSRE